MAETVIREELRRIYDHFWAQNEAKDYDGMADIYHEDARIMAHGHDVLTKADVPRTMQGYRDAGVAKGATTTDEVLAFGDMAVERGHVTFVNVDGVTVMDGKYIAVWKKQRGAWKCYMDMMNSNSKPQGGTPGGK